MPPSSLAARTSRPISCSFTCALYPPDCPWKYFTLGASQALVDSTQTPTLSSFNGNPASSTLAARATLVQPPSTYQTLVSLHIFFYVTYEACSLTLEAQFTVKAIITLPIFFHPFNYLPLLRPLIPFCLTDLPGSVALGSDNPGVVT